MPYPFPGLRKRYHEHYYADGLEELAMGVHSILIGAFGLLAMADDPSVMRALAGLGLVGFDIALGVYQKRIKGAIRERISYGRIGYVEPITLAEAGLHRRRTVIIVCFVLFNVLFFGWMVLFFADVIPIPQMPNFIRVIPALFGLGYGAVGIYDGLRLASRRHAMVMGAICIVLGIVFSIGVPSSLTGLPLMRSALRGMALVILCWALMAILSGAFTLWRFVHTPLPSEPADA
jgi:hypothetical protein